MIEGFFFFFFFGVTKINFFWLFQGLILGYHVLGFFSRHPFPPPPFFSPLNFPSFDLQRGANILSGLFLQQTQDPYSPPPPLLFSSPPFFYTFSLPEPNQTIQKVNLDGVGCVVPPFSRLVPANRALSSCHYFVPSFSLAVFSLPPFMLSSSSRPFWGRSPVC